MQRVAEIEDMDPTPVGHESDVSRENEVVDRSEPREVGLDARHGWIAHIDHVESAVLLGEERARSGEADAHGVALRVHASQPADVVRVRDAVPARDMHGAKENAGRGQARDRGGSDSYSAGMRMQHDLLSTGFLPGGPSRGCLIIMKATGEQDKEGRGRQEEVGWCVRVAVEGRQASRHQGYPLEFSCGGSKDVNFLSGICISLFDIIHVLVFL
jgi:hypothetical protein